MEMSNAERDSEEGRSRRGLDQEDIESYDEVITDEAETDEGVFTVHRLDGKVFYEIPVEELGRVFLWVSQIERTTEGVGYGGQALGNRIVKWDRRGNQVLLKNVSYDIVANQEEPISRAVQAANNDTIVTVSYTHLPLPTKA